MYENFYLNNLYPLQDRVLKLLNGLDTSFYLTGGTALSRCYLKHRYSDDLDFFVNDNYSFKDDLIKIQSALDKNFNLEIQRTGERFQRMMLNSNDVFLKLEFINDVPYHFGDIESSNIFDRVDNPLNILSNKITAAIDRDEVKDFADILAITNYLKEIDWRTMFVSASSKSAGIFAPLFAERLANFRFEQLEQIKWNENYNWKELESNRNKILHSIVGL